MTPAMVVKTLSQSNMKKRVERLMTPKADGTFKVPKELVSEWKSGDQQKLIREFQSCGLDKDTHAKTRPRKNLLFALFFFGKRFQID